MRRAWGLFVVVVLAMCSGVTAARALDFYEHANTSKRLTAILAVGDVLPGDTERLIEYINAQPQRPVLAIYLASPGGDLYEGMRLGQLFREWHIKAVVEGGEMCASACALAFLGGHDGNGPWRSSSDNSQLGFHAFRSPDQPLQDEGETQRVVADVLRYGHVVDAPLELLVLNFATPSYEMYWLSEEEICTLGIKLWSNTTDSWIC